MSPSDRSRSRAVPLLAGVLLAASGLLLVAIPSVLAGDRPGRPPFEGLVFLGPILIIGGLVVGLRGLLGGSGGGCSRKNVLITGLVMLASGGLPMFFESGLLGTILFLTVALPGILVTLVGALMCLWDRVG